MILDSQNLFSNDQAITTSAASESVLDFSGDYDIQPGEPIHVLVQVTTNFAGQGSTTLSVTLQSDGDENFGSATSDLVTAAIDEAVLVAGYQFQLTALARNNEQYIRLYYTIASGPMTAGKVVAGLILDNQAGEAAT